MRSIIYDMPVRDRWNSVHSIPDILSNLNESTVPHKTLSDMPQNHLQEYFVKFMLIIEYILHPQLKGQVLKCKASISKLFNSERSFYTNIISSSPIGANFTKEGYIKVPALTASLNSIQEAWYKDNSLIIILPDKLTWQDLFKILAFKYSLIQARYPEIKRNEALFQFYLALINNEIDKANTCLNEILQSEEYKTAKNLQFKEFFKVDYAQAIIDKQNHLKALYERINEYLERFAETERRIEKTNDEIATLSNKTSVDHSEEVLEYLTKNPYVTDIRKTTDNTLRIYYKAPILYYDKDVIEGLKNRTDSDFKAKIYDIFLKEKYTLWTVCCIDFNPRNFHIRAKHIGGNYSVIGHPHIDEYLCLGNHPSEVMEWIRNNDFIGAITQTTAAVLNLNFYDGAVISRLLYNLKEESNDVATFKNNETGEMVSLDQIFETEGE